MSMCLRSSVCVILQYVTCLAAGLSAPFILTSSARAGLGCWSNVSGGGMDCVVDDTSCGEGTCTDGVCLPVGSTSYCLPRACQLCVPSAETCGEVESLGLLQALNGQTLERSSAEGCVFFAACEELTVGLSRGGSRPWDSGDYCYLDHVGHTSAVLWADGDCDGDGTRNADDLDPCLSVLVRMGRSLNFTPLRRHRTPCSASGARRVGADGVCANDGVVLACSLPALPCPDGGFCITDASSRAGVCTYGAPQSTPIVTCLGEPSCLVATRGDEYQTWADADCDQDMVANELDPAICSPMTRPPNDAGPRESRPDGGRVRFTGGGGVECSALRGARGPSSGLGLTVLSLLALVGLRRRRFLVA